MKIERPIFVNGFSRGGTTILTNLLASHPEVCTIGETHHVFKGTTITDSRWRIFAKCVNHELPVLLLQWENFFSPRLMRERKPLSRLAQFWIDRVLAAEKMRSVHPRLNQFKDADQVYTLEERQAARLLGKNIDGMIYTSDAWRTIYPDATFFGLVRNGLALCEGHLRRGRSAAELGWRYRLLAEKMLRDSLEWPRYQLLRFEDLVARPWQTLLSACRTAQLAFEQIKRVRMQARRVMTSEGQHRLVGEREWDVVWLSPEELPSYFEESVNQHQIRRLSVADRDAFLREAGNTMERLGYPISLQTYERPSSRWARAA